jgi:dTMP kinase
MPTMRRGRFITLEGGEGAGKSTQVGLLAEHLRGLGLDVITTREPGGAPLAERIRALIFAEGNKADALTELLLFAAARADHLAVTIRPALARGAWVISDRFADSTRAYQGIAGAVPAETVADIERHVVGATVPDLTLMLDIAPAEGLARVTARGAGNTFDQRNLAFHEAVRAAFLAIARAEPQRCAVVPATSVPETVAAAIRDVVTARLSPGGRS